MGIVDKAKDAAGRAVDVARKGAGEARDRAQEMGLRRRANVLAQQLGHVVVRQHEGEAGLDGEVERLVGEIRTVNAEIAGLEDD